MSIGFQELLFSMESAFTDTILHIVLREKTGIIVDFLSFPLHRSQIRLYDPFRPTINSETADPIDICQYSLVWESADVKALYTLFFLLK
jgi:hypothetical protein